MGYFRNFLSTFASKYKVLSYKNKKNDVFILCCWVFIVIAKTYFFIG